MSQAVFQGVVNGFEYIDFEPTTNVSERARAKLSRIFGESPSDSSTKAILRKTGDLFQGTLQVHSAVGTFVADVIGEDPIQVLDRLSRKVRSQLRLWKRTRAFLHAIG